MVRIFAPSQLRRGRKMQLNFFRFTGILKCVRIFLFALFAFTSQVEAVELGGYCTSLFEKFEQSDEYYRSFALAIGDERNICTWDISPSDAMSECRLSMYQQRLEKTRRSGRM